MAGATSFSDDMAHFETLASMTKNCLRGVINIPQLVGSKTRQSTEKALGDAYESRWYSRRFV